MACIGGVDIPVQRVSAPRLNQFYVHQLLSAIGYASCTSSHTDPAKGIERCRGGLISVLDISRSFLNTASPLLWSRLAKTTRAHLRGHSQYNRQMRGRCVVFFLLMTQPSGNCLFLLFISLDRLVEPYFFVAKLAPAAIETSLL